MTQNTRLDELLGLSKPAVAVAFPDAAPDGVERIESSAVAGCAYWKIASQGQTFYTTAEDHYNCPIGAYTHHVEMPDEVAAELDEMLTTMVDLEYLSGDEVPDIPRREQELRVAAYAPLNAAPFDPGVVLVAGSARQVMLLAEASHAAGVESTAGVVGRPSCAAIPEVLRTGQCATNLACIGSRVYTELDEGELYFVFAGEQLDGIVEKLETIVEANSKLQSFHRQRNDSGQVSA
ncbi:MAG: DUF169 domain-containing protein [Planctomycetaceae bacterium]